MKNIERRGIVQRNTHLQTNLHAMYIQSKATTIYHNLGHCIVAASGNIVLTKLIRARPQILVFICDITTLKLNTIMGLFNNIFVKVLLLQRTAVYLT